MTEVRTVKQHPPLIWLRPCSDYLPSRIDVDDTGDLARVIPTLVSAIEQCNEDKTWLREWAAER